MGRKPNGGRTERISRSKDKSGGDDKIRKLKIEIDALKRENLQLRKLLNKTENEMAQYINRLEASNDPQANDEVDDNIKGDEQHCEDCGKGLMIKTTEIIIRDSVKKFYTCNVCGHGKVIKE
jgi:hypothetical protein